MSGLIKRKDAIEAHCELCPDQHICCPVRNGNICPDVEVFKLIPSAQPERKKGEWEEIEVIPEAYDIAGVKTWASMMRCNQCGFTTFAIEGHFAQYDFCPSCGADMRGER